MNTNNKQKISLIIPTLNAEPMIEQLILSLKKQSLYPFEIIIIDSSSDDKTVELAKKNDSTVYIIKRSEFNHGKTRGLAATLAKGNILVFLTQDVIVENNNSIEKLLKCFDGSNNIACVYGRQISKNNAPQIEMYSRLINYPPQSMIKSKDSIKFIGIKAAFCSNSFSAYRKDMLTKVGNFPKNIIFGEDMYIAAKLILSNYKIAYIANAVVYHSHNYSLIQHFKRNFDIGVFHVREQWIEDSFGLASRTGIIYCISLFKYIGYKRPFGLVKAFLVIFVRLIGHNLGKKERFIPMFLKRKLGLSQTYWSK